jgi:multiple sugar transport system substrate-binding protein
MQRTTRRRLLQLSGVSALTAASGGLAGILALGRAPAFAQGTTLHWVRGSDYVPVSDQTLRTKILEQCQKDLGIKFNLETVDGLTIQARVTSAVSSGNGPDIISSINNWAQLYAESVVDVSDVAEEIGKAQGGYYETSKAIAFDGKKWLAVPNTIVGLQIANRASWWNEIGYGPEKYPETWEEWREAGKKLKAQGRPLGQTLAHAFGDANAFWYPYLWSWGGKEVEADGKTVVLNSPGTVASVKFAVGLWKDACDEGAFAWDDSGNNRAFLSGTISATNNGASIYIEAKKKPDNYKTENGKPLQGRHFPHPAAQGAGRPVQLACAVRRHGHGLWQEPESGKGLPALVPHRENLRAVVGHAARLLGRSHQDVGEPPAVEGRPGHASIPQRGRKRSLCRLCWAGEPQGRRGDLEIYHFRHVCEGGAGHGAGGRRQMGTRGVGQGLRLN